MQALLLSVMLVPGVVGNDAAEQDWSVIRIGGDLAARAEMIDGRWLAGESAIEEALPEGYPAPTPPGAIDIKKYPSLRRAEFTGDTPGQAGMNGAFWPLFQHIKRRDIAMTSPVEMDLRGWSGDPDETPGQWTMSFLYRTADLGPTGRDQTDDRVMVVDTEPLTVVSTGVQGGYGLKTTRRGLEVVEAWLADSADWEQAGDPRVLYYNGPYIPDRVKWAEVQMPIRRIATASAGAIGSGANDRTIVTTAIDAGDFTTLVAAVKAADLVEALNGDGPLTVFAPTDDAFAALPTETLAALLKPENKGKLVEVLTYHVVAGRVSAVQAASAGAAPTLEGERVTFEIADGRLNVNNAAIIANDIDAGNGIIHVIDTVLLPPDFSLAPPTLTARQLIELAIARGAPLYNAGQREACAAIYEVTAQALRSRGDLRLSDETRSALDAVIANEWDADNARDQAWALRRALEAAYQDLNDQLTRSRH